MLECNSKNLIRIVDEAKQRINAMDMHDSDYVIIFTTLITSISKTLNNLWMPSEYHSSYIKTIYNGK